MTIFKFLMLKLHDNVTEKSNFGMILLSGSFIFFLKVFMRKRYDKYFEEKNASVKAEIGPPKYRVDMKVTVLTRSMVDEQFVIKTTYLDNSNKIYLYDLEDMVDGTKYDMVPEKFLCPMNPQRLAGNNVSFDDFMVTLTAGKKSHHDVAW